MWQAPLEAHKEVEWVDSFRLISQLSLAGEARKRVMRQRRSEVQIDVALRMHSRKLSLRN